MGKQLDGILTSVRNARGGIRVKHNKNTADQSIERMPIPQTVVIPMSQNIGAPCTPCVKVGEIVSVGQKIGDSESFVSAPIHASISGKVKSVADIKMAHGAMSKAVTIESDGEMRLFEGLAKPIVETKQDLAKAVRESGVVGLGGAGFPTHVKLSIPDGKEVDTMIVNAAECEPFITVDYRECLENGEYIMKGVYELKRILGIKNVVIAVEDNKPEAIKVLKEIADKDNDIGDDVKLMTLRSRYPQGAEKIMVLSATGRQVPPGKLPLDVGCIVINVATIAFIARYLETGKPLVSRSLTVDGSSIKNPKNVRVPIGTNIGEIIDFCGGFIDEPRKVIFGGPMMGIALYSIDAPVCKQNNAILAFGKKKKPVKPTRDCIKCGRCVSVCPMGLTPTLLESYATLGDASKLGELNIMSCMECGSCAYACPSGRPLVQYMRLGKQVIREESQK